MAIKEIAHFHIRKAFGQAAKTTYNGTDGAATSVIRLIGKKTGIADAVATSFLRITIPNANNAAKLEIHVLTSNGSTDAFESARCLRQAFVFTRTPGLATMVGTATATDAQIATVAVGATHTAALSASVVSGANNATQTIDIQVNINDSGNVGGNQIVFHVELMNAEAQGITVAAV